jgi:hypothetical protein
MMHFLNFYFTLSFDTKFNWHLSTKINSIDKCFNKNEKIHKIVENIKHYI